MHCEHLQITRHVHYAVWQCRAIAIAVHSIVCRMCYRRLRRASRCKCIRKNASRWL